MANFGQERESLDAISTRQQQDLLICSRKKAKSEGKFSFFSARGILLAVTLLGVLEAVRTVSFLSNQPKRPNILISAEKLYFVQRNYSIEDEPKLNAINSRSTRTDEEIKSSEHLIDCVKYHFHQRKYYVKQRNHDPLALRLQLDLIARQLCFSDISAFASLEKFDDLRLTSDESSYQAYVAKFAHSESQYFSPDDLDELCRDKSKIFFTQKGYSTGPGMGSRLHLVVTHLHLILAYNSPERMLALEAGGWVYTNSTQCKYADLRCYFQQISQCVMTEKSLSYFDWVLWKLGLTPRWNDPNSVVSRSSNTVLPLKNNIKGTKDYALSIPQRYSSRGWLWYYSQIFYFLFQPNGFLENEFSQLKRKFSDHIQKQNSIFIHVRHGDKFFEADMFDANSYLQTASIIESKIPDQSKQNMTSIFIATDDQQIYAQMKEMKGQSFEFNHIAKAVYPTKAFKALERSQVDGSVEAVTIFKEIFMAINSNCFIGSFSSGLSRVMFKLMVATQGDLVPHYSLSPWSYDVNGEVQLSTIWLW